MSNIQPIPSAAIEEAMAPCGSQEDTMRELQNALATPSLDFRWITIGRSDLMIQLHTADL